MQQQLLLETYPDKKHFSLVQLDITQQIKDVFMDVHVENTHSTAEWISKEDVH